MQGNVLEVCFVWSCLVLFGFIWSYLLCWGVVVQLRSYSGTELQGMFLRCVLFDLVWCFGVLLCGLRSYSGTELQGMFWRCVLFGLVWSYLLCWGVVVQLRSYAGTE